MIRGGSGSNLRGILTIFTADDVKVHGYRLLYRIGQGNVQSPEGKEAPLNCRLTRKVCSRTLYESQFLANSQIAPQVSHNPSTNTVHQIPSLSLSIPQRPAAERQSTFAHPVGNRETPRRSMDPSVPYRPLRLERRSSPSEKNNDSSSSSSSDSETTAPLTQSRTYMRRSRFSSSKPPLGPLSDAGEDQEDSSPFLPFSDAKAFTITPPPDPSATLRITPEKLVSHRPIPGSPSKLETNPLSQTAHSSSSSAQSQPQSLNARPAQNPLSSLSPRQRRIAKEGSEGTPSMGSSFSDLDDASVTQSALEEALANEMSHGVASRMSTISQALRSRYL